MEETLAARTELASVLAAAAGLPAIDRLVFFERTLEGKPYTEIAASHGISVGAAKIKVYRARIRLMMARK
jgi:DNA-directed RNA polymerase specialized sigma24 family protein